MSDVRNDLSELAAGKICATPASSTVVRVENAQLIKRGSGKAYVDGTRKVDLVDHGRRHRLLRAQAPS